MSYLVHWSKNLSPEEAKKDFVDQVEPETNAELRCLNAVNLAQVLYKFNGSVINTVLHEDSDGKLKQKDSRPQALADATGKTDPSNANTTSAAGGKPAAESGSKVHPPAATSS